MTCVCRPRTSRWSLRSARVSHGVLSGSSAARRWSITTGTRLAPSFTEPVSGSSSPISMRSSVVLPAPLGPIRPMRSRRKMRVEKFSTIGALAEALGDVARGDGERARLLGRAGLDGGAAGRADLLAALLAQFVERAQAALVARAPRADALARPFGLALDQRGRACAARSPRARGCRSTSPRTRHSPCRGGARCRGRATARRALRLARKRRSWLTST